ncbi:cation diffusion facilitator CzcD-associated flavoprotein CzcO [Sphingomonas xinjiangensis]|uniref:Cation diffusion facilitator CzcD-associated flavoprotein CzcO n=1 Tax=Sphingomonas xinjiangensis TaxID=643568 RepID=A0A840YB52_9SPHN|nr:cation diffusion facilitator CzcD-associated flavoprotein CzcO [Sphingomonas xinjiangensis]
MTHVGVAIIGGGAAGIATPRTLIDAAKNMLLPEAKDRLGVVPIPYGRTACRSTWAPAGSTPPSRAPGSPSPRRKAMAH